MYSNATSSFESSSTILTFHPDACSFSPPEAHKNSTPGEMDWSSNGDRGLILRLKMCSPRA